MSVQPKTREEDDVLLEMLALRLKGWTSEKIGDAFGFTKSYVRAATNRVVNEDAKLHDDKIVFPKVTK